MNSVATAATGRDFWCAACGKSMPRGVVQCPACGLLAPSAMLNRYSLALWILILASNALYGFFVLPPLSQLQQSAGAKASAWTHFYLVFNPWVLGPLALLMLVMTGLKGRARNLPKFLTSSRLVAVGTLLALIMTLVGMFAGYIETLQYLPRLIQK